jgi:hypothetical protein
MKSTLPLVLVSGLLAASSTFAQMPGSGSPGVGAALTKLFGDVTAFTAKAQVRVLDKDQQETVSGPMDFALLDNKMRVEIDMTRMKNKGMTDEMSASVKEMGLSRVISIIRPDKKLIYVIYPDQKSWTSMPLPKAEADAAEKQTKLNKTALGKETIDGHPCVKNKVIVSDDAGQILEATTWNASDLKDFPVQIQTKEQENTSVVLYKQVQLAKPDAKQFEPPADYTKYNDVMELMQGLMKKVSEGK